MPPTCLGSALNPSFPMSLVKASSAPLLSGRARTVGPCEEVGMVEGERLTFVSLALPRMPYLASSLKVLSQLHTRVAHSSLEIPSSGVWTVGLLSA